MITRHIAWDFLVSPAEGLRDQGEELMEALLELEDINSHISDPATSSNEMLGCVTVDLEVTAEDEPAAIQEALNVIRTAIHKIGGATPEWPTADDLGPVHTEFEFRSQTVRMAAGAPAAC